MIVLANILCFLACLPKLLLFWLATFFPARAQAAVLRRLLRRNRHCAFGKQHRFGEVLEGKSEFQALPVHEYADFQPMIDAALQGQSFGLCGDRIHLFEPTSGTSGAPKWIPYTAALQSEFRAAIGPWLGCLYLLRPALFRGRQYWSISPSSPVTPPATGGGTTCGFADDADYLGPVHRYFSRTLFPVPSLLRQVSDPRAFEYLTLLFLLRDRNLRLISVWHPSFLTRLLDVLESEFASLLTDLRTGLIDTSLAVTEPLRTQLAQQLKPLPQRAAELATINGRPGASAARIWPRLQVISSWTGPGCEPWLGRLRRTFPGVLFQPKGLVATEGIVTLPFGRENQLVCAIRSHVLEFVEAETGTVKRAHELILGQDYSIMLSTGGGFYRYRLHDRVRVSGFYHRTPCLAFLEKDNQISDMVGEKLHPHLVAAALAEFTAGKAPAMAFAMLAPWRREEMCGYTLFVEASPGVALERQELESVRRRVEDQLCRNFHYQHARRLQQLQPLRLTVVTGDAMLRYCEHLRARGMRAGDIKFSALQPDLSWETAFGEAPGVT